MSRVFVNMWALQNNTSKAVSHLRSTLPINVMTEPLVLDGRNIPGEVRRYIYLVNGVSTKQTYLPLMDLDDMRVRSRDYVEVRQF